MVFTNDVHIRHILKEIHSRIADLDKENVLNKQRLDISDSVVRHCEEWQHRLRKKWNQTSQILNDLEHSPSHAPCPGPSK